MKNAYRFFLTIVFLIVALEGDGGALGDPLVQWGFDFQNDLTAVIHTHIIVSVLEICVALVILLWFWQKLQRGKSVKRKVRLERGSLIVPLCVFAAMLIFGVLYGQVQPGPNLTEALWEVRGFLMMIAGYFLIGMYIHDDAQANRLVWVVLAGAGILALNNFWIAIAYPTLVDGNDLAYDHTDSVVIGMALILCITIISYGGTRAQRRFAMIALPVFLVCLMIMKRRAAFPVIGVGLIVVVIFLLRLRPRLFWRYVPPVALLCALYLAVFWNNTGTLGQPARAISSQFTPDPRDYASNLYRLVEKANIQANIAASPIFGLGFGRPYTFYYPMVTDLSGVWPFFHYETHNAILWIWMKDGAIGFIAFWWLMGRSIYDGSRVVETQREEWALVNAIRRRFSRQRNRGWDSLEELSGYERVFSRTTSDTQRLRYPRSRNGPVPTLNLPHWQRSDEKGSVTARRSATMAILVTAICMIPMQVVYSYVDLGIVNERDMLLFGLMLGFIAQGHRLLGIQGEDKRKHTTRRHTPRKRVTIAETPAASDETRELARRILLLPAGRTRLPTVKTKSSRLSSRPLTVTAGPSQGSQPLPPEHPPAGVDTAPSSPLAPPESHAPAPTPEHARGGPRSRPTTRRTTQAPATSARQAEEPPLPWETSQAATWGGPRTTSGPSPDTGTPERVDDE